MSLLGVLGLIVFAEMVIGLALIFRLAALRGTKDAIRSVSEQRSTASTKGDDHE